MRGEPGAPTRAFVILPMADGSGRDPATRLHEACGLAEALDLEVVRADYAPLKRIHPSLYLGAGRVEALHDQIAEQCIGVVIIDTALSPVQQRNLERALDAKVVDRSGLILEIFGRRARTREGRLQVELARLAYERSRLVRTWTHLERQRGGLGKTGGPGETQIELDRRIIADRIAKLKLDIEDVRRTRLLQRRARQRAGLPSVALVGYTNAGKSSLFNVLTGANVFAKDMPFATLDPTARQVRLPSGRAVVLSDTVGFITDLPTELVASFRATLEEVTSADVLIHVRDISHVETEEQKQDVESVLEQLDWRDAMPPIIEAWNKLDLLDPSRRAGRLTRAHEGADVSAISARTGEGVNELLEKIDRLAFGATRMVTIRLDPADGRTRARYAREGRLVAETLNEVDGMLEATFEFPARFAADIEEGMPTRAAE